METAMIVHIYVGIIREFSTPSPPPGDGRHITCTLHSTKCRGTQEDPTICVRTYIPGTTLHRTRHPEEQYHRKQAQNTATTTTTATTTVALLLRGQKTAPSPLDRQQICLNLP